MPSNQLSIFPHYSEEIKEGLKDIKTCYTIKPAENATFNINELSKSIAKTLRKFTYRYKTPNLMSVKQLVCPLKTLNSVLGDFG
jgi:hypothetical protein